MIPESREADRIAGFLDLRAPARHADLAFVFGTRLPEPAYLAADLFRRDLVEYVVLTGGSNRATGVQEAMLHREILLERGVPEERIILETQSVNTFQNVELALPEIAARLDLRSITAVTAVVKWYHSRRCLMILKRHLPAGIRYYVESYEPEGVARSDWNTQPYARERVLKEWRYIPKYLERGNLAEVREDDGAYV